MVDAQNACALFVDGRWVAVSCDPALAKAQVATGSTGDSPVRWSPYMVDRQILA